MGGVLEGLFFSFGGDRSRLFLGFERKMEFEASRDPSSVGCWVVTVRLARGGRALAAGFALLERPSISLNACVAASGSDWADERCKNSPHSVMFDQSLVGTEGKTMLRYCNTKKIDLTGPRSRTLILTLLLSLSKLRLNCMQVVHLV